MKLERIANELKLELVCGDLDTEINRGCSGDLLSEIMRSCRSDSIWITVQSHVNVIAVAVVVGIKAIVLCNGYEYDETTIKRAEEEGISLLRTDMDPFTVAGMVYKILEAE